MPELAFERRGCDPQKKLQPLRGQMRRICRSSQVDIRNARRILCGTDLRISIFEFRLLRGGSRNVGIES